MANVKPRDLAPWLVLVAGVYVGYRILKGMGLFTPGAGTQVTPPVGQRPTLNRTALEQLAERIYAAAWEGWIFYEDEDDIIRALKELKNDADFAALFSIYGVRRGPFTLDAELNLTQTVQVSLTDDEVSTLNAALAANGLTVRF